MSDPIQTINDYRMRILKCNALIKEGKHQEAATLEPTPEELREALIALRSARGKSTPKKSEPKVDPYCNLNDLFKGK